MKETIATTKNAKKVLILFSTKQHILLISRFVFEIFFNQKLFIQIGQRTKVKDQVSNTSNKQTSRLEKQFVCNKLNNNKSFIETTGNLIKDLLVQRPLKPGILKPWKCLNALCLIECLFNKYLFVNVQSIWSCCESTTVRVQ